MCSSPPTARHAAYQLIETSCTCRSMSARSELEDYPVRAEDILHTGVEAFAAALNTVNVGKFNLCSASIGMAEHASTRRSPRRRTGSCTATR